MLHCLVKPQAAKAPRLSPKEADSIRLMLKRQLAKLAPLKATISINELG